MPYAFKPGNCWFTTRYGCQSDHKSLFNLCCNGAFFMIYDRSMWPGKRITKCSYRGRNCIIFFNVDIFFTPKGQRRSTIILESFCLNVKIWHLVLTTRQYFSPSKYKTNSSICILIKRKYTNFCHWVYIFWCDKLLTCSIGLTLF